MYCYSTTLPFCPFNLPPLLPCYYPATLPSCYHPATLTFAANRHPCCNCATLTDTPAIPPETMASNLLSNLAVFLAACLPTSLANLLSYPVSCLQLNHHNPCLPPCQLPDSRYCFDSSQVSPLPFPFFTTFLAALLSTCMAACMDCLPSSLRACLPVLLPDIVPSILLELPASLFVCCLACLPRPLLHHTVLPSPTCLPPCLLA